MTEDVVAKLRAIIEEQARHRDLQAEKDERKHRKDIAQQLDRALTANLKLWLDVHNMHEMPEAFVIDILTNTGLQGGDAGHGGHLAIRFKTDSGCNAVMLRPSRRANYSQDGLAGEVVLTARGDWEQEGLISGLASLLLTLLETVKEGATNTRCKEQCNDTDGSV